MAASSLSELPALAPHPPLTDSHGRVIHDLRVSITDRCNYKCVYCRTGEEGAQYPELRADEYLRLIALFVSLGITKVRLTGGEPLLRRGVVELVRELAQMRTLAGEPLDLALTTNGHLLESLAEPLKAAGLNRVTVSMDAVDATVFERITRIEGSYGSAWRIAQVKWVSSSMWRRVSSFVTGQLCSRTRKNQFPPQATSPRSCP